MTPSANCAGCPMRIWASPGSITTGTSARASPKPSTGRARRPSSAPPSSPSCWAATPGPVLLTRATEDQAKATSAATEALGYGTGEVSGTGPTLTVVFRPAAPRPGTVVVVTAGTADLPVATECASVLGALGFAPTVLVDCGVAGLHRLLSEVDQLAAADAVVVIAGMEGALASVVGGLTPAPVVAVPTSTGYGAAFEGVTALLAMLAACASGVTVVGIDNGFGAACAIARLLP